MLSYLITTLSNDIEVGISPDYFNFKRKGQETNFKTIIYISTDGKPRVLGVGDEHIPTEPHIKIELFKPEGLSIVSFDKAECLEEFFRYCIRKTVNRTALIRPRIVFRNAASLKGILCGYERMILKHTAINAGARECLFQECTRLTHHLQGKNRPPGPPIF
jgi:hypothetical protein